MSLQFENAYCKVSVIKGSYDHELLLKGRINVELQDNVVYYIAASPPDYRFSFSGSGLPYASQVQAFENTPNIGKVVLNNGEFEIKLMTPNSYYVGLGTVYISPRIYLEFFTKNGEKKNVSIVLSKGIPYRSLTHPGVGQETKAKANVTFFESQFYLPIRSQEQILYDSAYPAQNKMHPNFWGLKPPM